MGILTLALLSLFLPSHPVSLRTNAIKMKHYYSRYYGSDIDYAPKSYSALVSRWLGTSIYGPLMSYFDEWDFEDSIKFIYEKPKDVENFYKVLMGPFTNKKDDDEFMRKYRLKYSIAARRFRYSLSKLRTMRIHSKPFAVYRNLEVLRQELPRLASDLISNDSLIAIYKGSEIVEKAVSNLRRNVLQNKNRLTKLRNARRRRYRKRFEKAIRRIFSKKKFRKRVIKFK